MKEGIYIETYTVYDTDNLIPGQSQMLTIEEIEVMRCPHCMGIVGIDETHLDQVGTEIVCPMCSKIFHAPDPTEVYDEEDSDEI